jgi:hypothetical protein
MTREVPIKPPWTTTKYSFDMLIAHYNKKETSTHKYKNLFYEVSNKLSDHIHIYTDASKTDNGVGVAAVIQQTELSERLSDYCSIYSAEASLYIKLYSI